MHLSVSSIYQYAITESVADVVPIENPSESVSMDRRCHSPVSRRIMSVRACVRSVRTAHTRSGCRR